MQIADLIEGLETLGLDRDEAEVYVRLLQSGPSKVGTLAEVVDVSRSTLYRLLDDLADRGVVTKSLERPTIYEAEPPEELFDTALHSIERRRTEVEEARDALLDGLTAISGEPLEREVHHWHLLEGQAKIRENVGRLIEGATSAVWAVSNQGSRTPAFGTDAFAQFLQGRTGEGVSVRGLLDPKSVPAQLPEGKEVEVRRLDTEGNVHFLVVDRTTVVAWLHSEPGNQVSRDDVAIWTDAPGLVEGHRMLFERLWDESEPVR